MQVILVNNVRSLIRLSSFRFGVDDAASTDIASLQRTKWIQSFSREASERAH